MAFSNGYTYRRLITVDHTKVSGGSDLTSFPALISGTYSYLATVANGGRLQYPSSIPDIRFELTDGTKLDHEIDEWVSTTGQLMAWVRIPTLSASADTQIFIYYGKDISVSEENKNGVWRSEYKGVWHLGESAGVNAADSTNNGVNLTQQASPGAVTGAFGDAAGGKSFNGTTQRFLSANNVFDSVWTNKLMTLSGWVKPPNSTATGHVMENEGWQVVMWSNDADKKFITFSDGIGTSRAKYNTAYTDNGWHYVVAKMNATTVWISVDGGAFVSGASTFANPTTARGYSIGSHPTSFTNAFTGAVDEARVLFATFSDGWHITEYNNQSSPSTFYSVSGESQSITGTGIASTAAFGSANLKNVNSVTSTGIASTASIGNASITPGAAHITATGITSTNNEGNPAVKGKNTILASGIDSTAVFGTAKIIFQQFITATGRGSTVAFGAPSVDTYQRYWVGTTGDWFDSANWSYQNGGAGGAPVPTWDDDVFINSGSGTISDVSGFNTAYAKSIDCTGFSGTLNLDYLYIGGDWGPYQGGNVTLPSTMTLNVTYELNVFSDYDLTFTAPGHTLPGMYWLPSGNGATPTFTLGSSLNINGYLVNSVGGYLDTAGYNITTTDYLEWDSQDVAGGMTLHSSVITCITPYFQANETYTLDAGTSSLTASLDTRSGAFYTPGATWYDITINANSGKQVDFDADVTIHNLTINNTDVVGSKTIMSPFRIYGDLTISDQLTLSGTRKNPIHIQTQTSYPSQSTITAGATALSDVMFEGINAAGAAIPWTGIRLIDLGNNTNITFPTTLTRYWVGNGGTWSDTAHWSLTSGGAGGASAPTAQDNAVFDANSFTSSAQTLNLDTGYFKTLDTSAIINPIILNRKVGQTYVYGTLDLSGISSSTVDSGAGTDLTIAGYTDSTLNLGPHNYSVTVNKGNTSSRTTLTGDINIDTSSVNRQQLYLKGGVFDANGYNVSGYSILVYADGGAYFGTGTWSPSGGMFISDGVVLDNTATIRPVDGADLTGQSFNFGNNYINSLTLPDTTSGTNIIIFTGTTGKIGTFTVRGAHGLGFRQSTTTRFDNFDVQGTAANPITISHYSGDAGTFTLSQASGTVAASHINVSYSNATGGATWRAIDSTNSGNNTGWIFTSGITSTGIAPTSAFGSPTLVRGEVISTTGISSTVQFGSASLLPGVVTITASSINPTIAFGSAVMGFGQFIVVNGLPSSNAFGTPGIGRQIDATGISSSIQFGLSLITHHNNPTPISLTVQRPATPTITIQRLIEVINSQEVAPFAVEVKVPEKLIVSVVVNRDSLTLVKESSSTLTISPQPTEISVEI